MMVNPDYKCGTSPVNDNNRVCDTTCKVTEESTCTLKLKDGDRIILEGCTVGKEEMFAVKHDEFRVSKVNKVDVKHIVNRAKSKEEEENLEIKYDFTYVR